MTFTDQFWRAVADYALAFPDLASLGSGNPPAAWYTERNRVKATAFAAVLITASATEGGSATGQKNFPQEVLVDALDWRRHELDATYALPRHLRRNAGRSDILRFHPPFAGG